MCLAIYEIVWYISRVSGAYSIQPSIHFCKPTQIRRPHGRLFLYPIERVLYFDQLYGIIGIP